MTGQAKSDTQSIMADLTWINMVKGIAIIGVFIDNWNGFMRFDTSPAVLYSAATAFVILASPFVQVFFILSGFGLTLGYLKGQSDWSWGRWGWRRFTKIVIPYVLAVFLSFALGILGSRLYSSVDMQFSSKSLFAYLTFTRNFYPASWGWNYPMWFMPVIIGLYVSFPVLIKILEKWGVRVLLLISILITYGTITVVLVAGLRGGHNADLFTFWVIQFSFGIVLACIGNSQPQALRRLIGLKASFLGVGLYAFSWALRTYVPLGKVYNDAFTSIGIFLILLNLCWVIRSQTPAVARPLGDLGRVSYIMYLVHYPIIAFLIGPPLRIPTNPLVVISLGGVYIVAIYFLSRFISPPIERLTSWSYRLLYPPYRRDIELSQLGVEEKVVTDSSDASLMRS
jgi:peptidoglycan/LPS O-acetylase OafA/YrhL